MTGCSPARERLVAAARAQLGVRYAHQGRAPGLALDCVGLVIVAAAAAGIETDDVAGYSRLPEPGRFATEMAARLERVALDAVRPGDVLAFAWSADAQHVALVTRIEPLTIVHAHAQARRVVEHRVDELWRARVRAAWSFPGVDTCS